MDIGLCIAICFTCTHLCCRSEALLQVVCGIMDSKYKAEYTFTLQFTYLYLQEWVNCQRMFSVVGRESLNRRILDLNIQTLHPEILARVDQILNGLNLKQVQHISAGAATFYVWVST